MRGQQAPLRGRRNRRNGDKGKSQEDDVLNYIPHDVVRDDRADGSILLHSRVPLGPVARSTGAWLHEWAENAANRVFIAERSGEGWREVRYAEALQQVRAIAASLLARNLGPDRPICVISGNSVDHAMLALAGQYAVETVHPGLIFADDGGAYGAALALDFMNGIERVVARNGDKSFTAFTDLLKGDKGPNVDAAHAEVGPDTLAKT